jgi:hypothetical protein
MWALARLRLTSAPPIQTNLQLGLSFRHSPLVHEGLLAALQSALKSQIQYNTCVRFCDSNLM